MYKPSKPIAAYTDRITPLAKMARLAKTRIHCGYIAPTSLLYDTVPIQSRFHLCLPHLIKNDTYRDFYTSRQRRGDMIILDNGAFEFGTPWSPSSMVVTMCKYSFYPDVVVAPDYPGRPYKETLEGIDKMATILDTSNHPLVNRCQIMAVPQSSIGDAQGWLSCYHELLSNPRVAVIGISILATPNAFSDITATKDIAVNRIYATSLILSKTAPVDISSKWHHYLGLGTPNELAIQSQLGVMDSIDTSSPIWHGIHGIAYDVSSSGLKDGKMESKVDFAGEYELNANHEYAIRYNINRIEHALYARYD